MQKADLRVPAAGGLPTLAEVWQAGWRDAHLGHVPDALLASRDRTTFLARLDAEPETLGAPVTAQVDRFDNAL